MIDIAVMRQAAFVFSWWKFRCDGQRRFAELGRIDPVIDEWRSQRDRAAAIAIRGGEVGEVAGKHRRGWHESLSVCRILAGRGALVAAEEEQFIFDDRPAQRSAELISLESALHLVTGFWIDGREIWRGIEKIVAQEFEDIAVNFVRSGFRHAVNVTTGLSAVLCRDAAGLHFEFLKRIGKWERLA